MKELRRRKKLMVALATLLGLALAACARPTATPSPTPGVAPTPPPGLPQPTPMATPAAQVKPSGELRVAVDELGVEVGDPTLGPVQGQKNYLGGLVYDYLVGATPEGQLAKELGLAENWEVSHSAASSTYTFYIRKGARFHNGDEVTAEDVKFSIEYFMRPAAMSSGVDVLRKFVDRIETPERYKVVVHTKQPYAFLHIDLSPIQLTEGFVLPKRYIQEKGEQNFNLNPVGSGPYRFKNRVTGSYVQYEAVENHWRIGVPKYKTLTFFLIPEETIRIAMLKTGQADVAIISRERAKEVTGAGLATFLKPASWMSTVFFGNGYQRDTYLGDKRVREALNLAINREEILKFIFEGQGRVVSDGYFGSYGIGYQPLPPYPYDPERARKLLAEASPGGVSLSYDSFPWTGLPEIMRMNEAVAGMWEKVGVKTKIVPMEYGAHRALWAKAALPNMVFNLGAPNRPFWAGIWRLIFHSKGTLTVSKIPELDKLIESAEQELDLARFGQRQQEISNFVRENHLVGMVLETGALLAANPQKIKQWDMGKIQHIYNFPDLVERKG